MISGLPGVMGAALEPSGFSPSLSQRELRSLNAGFGRVWVLEERRFSDSYLTEGQGSTDLNQTDLNHDLNQLEKKSQKIQSDFFKIWCQIIFRLASVIIKITISLSYDVPMLRGSGSWQISPSEKIFKKIKVVFMIEKSSQSIPRRLFSMKNNFRAPYVVILGVSSKKSINIKKSDLNKKKIRFK
jgi:hypothetical protein